MGNKSSSLKGKDKSSTSLLESSKIPLETRARFKYQDLKMLESLFSELEDDKNHTLDKSTFLKLFPRASGLMGERLYLRFDTTNDGLIDFTEFLNGIGLYIKGDEHSRIEFLFNMFDYTQEGQLTRDGLSLMLHSLIITDDVHDEEEADIEDFNYLRTRQSLHVPSVHSVDSTDYGSTTNSNDNNNNTQNQNGNGPSSNHSTPTISPQQSTKQLIDVNHLPDQAQISRAPSQYQPTIDPRLMAEENRIASLFNQLHDLNQIESGEHINIIHEITIASKISPEQAKLTIEQLVDYAFKSLPHVSPDPNDPQHDYLALEHFETFIHRNPCILQNLEEILDCITWLDPRSDEQRLRSTDEGNFVNVLQINEGIPQCLCCERCGFTIRHCPLCGSGLTHNASNTFSICNNESSGLCGGWTTEGKFEFCLQCGDRLQAGSLPITLHPTGQDITVVLTPQPSRLTLQPSSSIHKSSGTIIFNTHDNSVETNSIQSSTGTHDNDHKLNRPNLILQQSQSTNTSVHQLQLDSTTSQPHLISAISESPNHKAHTSQHGHHYPVETKTRKNRTSSNHLPSSTQTTPQQHSTHLVNRTAGTSTPLYKTPSRHVAFDSTSTSSHHHATTHKQLVHYEGQVYIRSNGLIKHLKSRWILCRGAFLYLFREREDKEPLSILFLEGSFINPLDQDNDAESAKDLYGFEIKTKTQRHTYYIKQHDQRQSWVKILRQASKTQQIENFYTFQKQVGKGKFATVYQATSRLNPDRKYAVKVISKLLMEKPEHLEQLRAEISIIKLAHHPNIIRMKEMFEDQHNIYLVMPLISGGDMFDRILLRKHFSEATSKIIMWRLFSAVEYLHDREIVHCDIKPENILLLDDVEDDNVILADFGLSSFFDPGADGLHKQQGTISYLAPEVLRGEYYSKTIDIYALGVCAYLFLSGQLPFQGYSQDEIIEETLKGEVHFGEEWDSISLTARLFVQHLLSPNSCDRPSAAQALLDPWFDSVRNECNPLQQTRFKKTLSQHVFSSTDSHFGSPTSSQHHNGGNCTTTVQTITIPTIAQLQCTTSSPNIEQPDFQTPEPVQIANSPCFITKQSLQPTTDLSQSPTTASSK